MTKQYKRYMIFTWSDYDNVSPFSCFDSDYDDYAGARMKFEMLKNDEFEQNACIFDRIEGVILKKFGEGH